jgi:hypothetical protein
MPDERAVTGARSAKVRTPQRWDQRLHSRSPCATRLAHRDHFVALSLPLAGATREIVLNDNVLRPTPSARRATAAVSRLPRQSLLVLLARLIPPAVTARTLVGHYRAYPMT